IFPRKVDFSCFGYHPDLESRLTFQEKWVLVAWQGSESPSRAMASNDPLVDAIRTGVDAVVSLRQPPFRHIDGFSAAAADSAAAGIPSFNAQGLVFETSQNGAS
ncbi:hypothetical protein, partial [Bradyrhizobium diazoefficiens]|uniref:hypothetical protein n=1 Tax=Bradyrhizobium diazoefficiens TaxID=1355477 RepID=UPI001B8AE237